MFSWIWFWWSAWPVYLVVVSFSSYWSIKQDTCGFVLSSINIVSGPTACEKWMNMGLQNLTLVKVPLEKTYKVRESQSVLLRKLIVFPADTNKTLPWKLISFYGVYVIFWFLLLFVPTFVKNHFGDKNRTCWWRAQWPVNFEFNHDALSSISVSPPSWRVQREINHWSSCMKVAFTQTLCRHCCCKTALPVDAVCSKGNCHGL